MRYVPYDPIRIGYPPDWRAQADAALKSVEAVPDDQRAKEIDKYRDLWARLRPELAKIMGHKCWYTEAPQTGTDTDVDHFRPKNAVKGVRKPGTNETHPGYWWLAFDPANYRYSCIMANRPRRDLDTGLVGGKADEFPVWDEGRRAWRPDDDYTVEQPLLIDPCKRSEVAYISFTENGEAIARHDQTRRPRASAMATNSIKLYHLNHPDFVRERIKIRDQVMKHIQDARRYFKRLDSDDADADLAFERVIEQLCEACSEKAPFSSFAIAILAPYREEECLAGVSLAINYPMIVKSEPE